MGKPKAPRPPDPVATANAQGQANRDAAIATAQMGMVDQQTPFGSYTYEQIGEYDDGTPRFAMRQELSPEQQQLLSSTQGLTQSMVDTATNQMGQVRDALGQPINFDGAPAQVTGLSDAGLPSLTQDFSADRQRVEDALMDRMNPGLTQDRQALEQRLANQGLVPGSEAYNRAVDEANRQANDARLAVIGQAGNEQSRLTGLSLGTRAQGLGEQQVNANLQNQGRAQFINETLLQRQTPLNEIAALTSGSQVQMPQFMQTSMPTIQAPDVMGATYGSHNAAMQNYQQQMQNRGAFTGGLFNLLGAGATGAGMFFGRRPTTP